MHHPRCLMLPRNCQLGEAGHCRECPFRGWRADPRYRFLKQIQSAALSVEHGYPVDQIEADAAAVLWPEHERDWIAREDRWAERARYHAAMHADALLREVLTEAHDLSAARSRRAA